MYAFLKQEGAGGGNYWSIFWKSIGSFNDAERGVRQAVVLCPQKATELPSEGKAESLPVVGMVQLPDTWPQKASFQITYAAWCSCKMNYQRKRIVPTLGSG